MLTQKYISYKVLRIEMKLLIIVLTLLSISWCNGSSTIEKFFLKFGQYEFINENGQSVVKSYYSGRDLSLNWLQAFQTCKAFDMDLVELPTEAEQDYLLALCQTQAHQLNGKYHAVGASYVGVGTNEYYWMTTGQRVNYSFKWAPGQPNNIGRKEKYLNIRKYPKSFLFNDVYLSLATNFICQRITNTTHDGHSGNAIRYGANSGHSYD